jgi:prephenate dehydrogenase
MRVAVVGLGLIGGSIALDLKRSGFAKEIIGVDASLDHTKQALELKIADRVEPLPVAVRDSDLIILAVPVGVMVNMLPSILDIAPDRTTITDMGSTKLQVSQSVENHPKRNKFVASHPMAGTENSGPKAAIEGLFMSKTAVICDPEKSDPAHLKTVRDMYHALGMRLVEMASSEHDLKVAFVSHLSHISSFALANVVLDKEKNVNTIFDLAGGGFESTVRLAKSSPEMWLPIFDQNRDHVLDALDGYIEHLYRFREGIAALGGPDSAEKQECLALMRNANQIRRVLKKG